MCFIILPSYTETDNLKLAQFKNSQKEECMLPTKIFYFKRWKISQLAHDFIKYNPFFPRQICPSLGSSVSSV